MNLRSQRDILLSEGFDSRRYLSWKQTWTAQSQNIPSDDRVTRGDEVSRKSEPNGEALQKRSPSCTWPSGLTRKTYCTSQLLLLEKGLSGVP